MNEQPRSAAARSVLLLFLGNPLYDRRIKSFADAFVARGWEVEVLYGIPNDQRSGRSKIGNARFTQVSLKSERGPQLFFEYHRKIAAHTAGLRAPTVVMASDLYSLRCAQGVKARETSTLLIYDSREIYLELPSLADRPVARAIWKRVESAGLSATDLIVVTAPYDVNPIFDEYRFLPRSVLVRNLPTDRLEVSSPDLRMTYGLKPDQTLYVYVGGLQKDRGLELFIRALQHIDDNSVFVLIGDGALRGELDALVRSLGLAPRVKFHGPVESDRVLSLLASADVGVSLIEDKSKSYEHALPSKIFEYLYAGLPVISSDLIHISETFREDNSVLRVDTSTQETVVRAARDAALIASDREARETRSRDARAKFSFEADFASLNAAVEHMLRARTP